MRVPQDYLAIFSSLRMMMPFSLSSASSKPQERASYRAQLAEMYNVGTKLRRTSKYVRTTLYTVC